VGASGAFIAAGEARAAERRPPADPQRHFVGAQQRGATCRAATARWARCRAGSTAGGGRVCGSACWRRCRPTPGGGSAGNCTSWTARSYQHAAGARKAGREPGAEDEALGRSRGGFTIHVRCEGYGKPVTFTLTGGQVHDSQQVTALIDRGAIRRIGKGRPRLRPAKLAGDKAYSSRSIRQALRKRGITPVIPTKSGASPTSTARHTASATSSSA
jgi:hypothetical protein